MLQRIQTVYLFLVFVFAILFIMLPLANLQDPFVSLQLSRYPVFFDAFDELTGRWMALLLVILFFAVILLTVASSFYYKKRLVQIKLGKYNLLIHATMILISFFLIDSIRTQLDHLDKLNQYEVSYGPGIIFPVISLLFILMANRAIRKDENLVRAADRIR